jgi:hypothetical protein
MIYFQELFYVGSLAIQFWKAKFGRFPKDRRYIMIVYHILIVKQDSIIPFLGRVWNFIYGTALSNGPIAYPSDDRWICSIGKIMIGKGNQDTCPSATFSAKKFKWLALGTDN